MGITLRDAGTGLGVSPASALTPELKAAIAVHKTDLLMLLAAGYVTSEPPDAASKLVAERLGNARALGVAAHTGSPTWLIAVGEAIGGKPVDQGAAQWSSALAQVSPGPYDRGPEVPGWVRSLLFPESG